MTKDLRPYSVVNTLEPRYKIPSRTHFSDSVAPKLYEEVKSKVVTELKSASAIALTTDGWTSRATQSYETVTAHFINQQWKIQNYILQTRVPGVSLPHQSPVREYSQRQGTLSLHNVHLCQLKVLIF